MVWSIPKAFNTCRARESVEFGLSWGITRLHGGYFLATMAKERHELEDTKFALRAVKDHIGIFGKPPRAFAYDRGGYSSQNVRELKKLQVNEVGLAPRRRSAWAVGEAARRRLVKERALVEAGIGTIKSSRYGFNRPAARSAALMGPVVSGRYLVSTSTSWCANWHVGKR